MNFYGQSKREVPIEQPRSKREIAFDQARFDKVWPTCVSILKKQWKSSEKQEVSKFAIIFFFFFFLGLFYFVGKFQLL